jgi:formate dehydrogenase subunit gamma
MPGVPKWNKERAGKIIGEHLKMEGPVLPILHALQHEFGFIPDEAVVQVAEAVNATRAEIHGVVTFYHDFRRAPAGRHVLKLCRAEACQSVGADGLAEHAKTRLGIAWGETSANGAVTLEPVFCLGFCALGPAALLDGAPAGRLDRAALDELIDGCAP